MEKQLTTFTFNNYSLIICSKLFCIMSTFTVLFVPDLLLIARVVSLPYFFMILFKNICFLSVTQSD